MVYLFWGPLFPFSPVKPGFHAIKKGNYTLIYKNSVENIVDTDQIDEIIKIEEIFHDLEYREKFKIIILDENSSMKRFLPWKKGSGYSVSLGVANIIYIGPAAVKSAFGINTYIKHELSHMLLAQNTSSYKFKREIHKQGWLAEGLAIYFGGPRFYSEKDFKELWKHKAKDQADFFKSDFYDIPLDEIRLYYSAYGYFIQYLIIRYGLEKLQDYIKLYIADPFIYRAAFYDIYSSAIESVWRDFILS